jgi:tetratricopeptide (TPR) repeat protein
MFDDGEDENGFNDGQLSSDLERFEAFLKGESMGFLDSDRWEALVDHLLITGQYSKALTCVDEALSQFSYNTVLRLRKAQAYSAMGSLKESLNQLTELEREGIVSMEVYLTKAAVFSQLKDSKHAIKYFKLALSHASPIDKDEIYLDLAMEYQNKGDIRLAINVLNEAINENAANEGAVYELAHCYETLGDMQRSISCYSDFLDNNPYSFTGWYNLGNAYAKIEDHEKAMWAYDYCVLINGSFGPAYFNLGHTHLSLDRYTKAIEYFNKSMELDGADPLAMCYIGECHEQLGELEQAKEYYKKSMELAPMLPDAWLGLGIVEDLEGRTQEGIVLIKKASELDPENASIFHVLAGAYEKIEDREKAYEAYQMSLVLDPSDEECLLNYIQLLSEESVQIAYDYIETFEELNAENPLLFVIKASLLWRLGHSEQSIELFKSCLEMDREKALEIFEFNPALKNVPEFVILADQ